MTRLNYPALIGSMIVAGLATSPATAQRKTHGAGVSWSGGHGGVSWDGGHDYRGGSYDGYPPSSPTVPAYKPPRPAYILPQISLSLVDPARTLVRRRDDYLNPSRTGEPDKPHR